MNTQTSDHNFLRRYVGRTLAAAFTIIVAGLVACGGGGSSSNADSGVSLTAFNALQAQVNALQASVTADEKLLANVALIGHAPGTSAVTAFAERTSGVRTLAISLPGSRSNAVDFGQCTNMGQYVGSGAPNPSGSTVDFFKQCTGVTYGVNSSAPLPDGNFPVAQPAIMWFDGPNCTGNVIQFANDGQYNYHTLLGGIVFISPVDGTTEYWVQATAAGVTPGNLVSASIYTAHTCSPDVETHVGFIAILNVTDGTGSSGSGVSAEVPPYVL